MVWLLALLLLVNGCNPCINCAPPNGDSLDFSEPVPVSNNIAGSDFIAPTHDPAPQPTNTQPQVSTAAPTGTAAVIVLPEPTQAGAVAQPFDISDSTDLLPGKIVDPTLIEKRIVVDISEQRVYAYENNRIVGLFQASTGRNQNTATGSFKILDKKLRPYSEPWDFWMPHWMGIYWVAGLKNGFHAPPVLENGQVLWADQIGTPATNGCIMLLPEDMEKLYHWSEVGMPVEIIE